MLISVGQQNAVSACPDGNECGSCITATAADLSYRQGVLFRRLPIRGDAGHHVVAERKAQEEKYRFTYSKEVRWLRYSALCLFIVSVILGIHAIVVLLAPYSSYGRIASNLFAPVYDWGNNLWQC